MNSEFRNSACTCHILGSPCLVGIDAFNIKNSDRDSQFKTTDPDYLDVALQEVAMNLLRECVSSHRTRVGKQRKTLLPLVDTTVPRVQRYQWQKAR
jgi:hypothetical protein